MRSTPNFLHSLTLALTVVVLQACGGGGGGGTTIPAVTDPTVNTPVINSPVINTPVVNTPVIATPVIATPVIATPVITAPPVTVSGTATYQFVPYRPASVANVGAAGSLNYAASLSKPIRGVTIQAVKNSGTALEEILSTTTTSNTGSYALNVPSNTGYVIRIRAELIKTAGAAQWDVRVLDNTAANALWVLETAPASTTSTNVVRNLNAGTTWNNTGYTQSSRPAGIFTMLDTMYTSIQQIVAAQPAAVFPKLAIYWSPLNTDTPTQDLATGQLGGKTFFRFSSTTTFSGGVTTTTAKREIYVLGKADADADEFDIAVIAHEFGHYLQNVFSVGSVSTGGGHGEGDKLDMTLAFSEGWGNAYSSIARNDAIYADSFGPGQASGFVIDFSNTTAIRNKGWFNEDSVTNSLYKFYVSAGFAPIWTALTGPMRTQASLPTIFSFAAAVRSTNVATVTTALNSVISANLISTTADEWGTGETNNGGDASNLPVYNPLVFNTATPVCYTTVNMTDPTDINKLGMVRYHRHTLSPANAAALRTVQVNFEANRDVDFDVYQTGVRKARADAVTALGGTSESKTVTLSAGEVVIRTRDYITDTAPANCATLIIK
jgi:hypothetical protein